MKEKLKKKGAGRQVAVHDEDAVRRCIEDISSGLAVSTASRIHGIPRSTLRYRLTDRWQHSRRGPPSVLTEDEERKLESWIVNMQQRGFPVQRGTLMFKVKDFLSATPRDTPFANGCPGRTWFNAYMRRHPNLSLRTPEEVTSASARVTESDIRNWFSEVSKWFDLQGMSDILQDPTRVFNGDETSFYLHPKTKEVIAQKGSRNVYEVEQACGKQNVTVMFTFNAAGAVVDPLTILPGQRIRKEIVQGFPPGWGLGLSEKGWMNSHNFGEHIKNIFHPFLLRNNIKLPVVLFVDGHCSHVGLEVADLCQQLGIILVALCPNTTRITQPADVAVFKPLKDQWKKEVDKWRLDHPGEIFALKYFGSVLEKAVEGGIKEDSIVNGFRVCGLFPFDADNVDYSKCIAKPQSTTPSNLAIEETLSTDDTVHDPNNNDTSRSLEKFVENTVVTTSLTTYSLPVIPNDPGTDANTPQFTVFSPYVSIHKDKIKEAVQLMGTSTLAKIQDSTANLSHEEVIIKYFFSEFIQPFTVFEQQSYKHLHNNASSLNVEELYNNESTTLVDEADATVDELLIAAEENLIVAPTNERENEILSLNESSTSYNLTSTSMPSSASNFEYRNHSECVETIAASAESQILRDVTNTIQTVRKVSISDILKLPPTPRRSGKHRNYAKKFFPVLTAEERIREISRVDREKREIEAKKLVKAAERAESKRRKEEAKNERAEERLKKKQEAEVKKQEKESHNKKKFRKAAADSKCVKKVKLTHD